MRCPRRSTPCSRRPVDRSGPATRRQPRLNWVCPLIPDCRCDFLTRKPTMITDVLASFSRRRDVATGVAATDIVEAPPAAPDAPQGDPAAIRETIDLLESDLALMIQDVQRASGQVR